PARLIIGVVATSSSGSSTKPPRPRSTFVLHPANHPPKFEMIGKFGGRDPYVQDAKSAPSFSPSPSRTWHVIEISSPPFRTTSASQKIVYGDRDIARPSFSADAFLPRGSDCRRTRSRSFTFRE